MLAATKIRDALDSSLDASNLRAFALINTAGTVLESREAELAASVPGRARKNAESDDRCPPKSVDGYVSPEALEAAEQELLSMNLKLQTKIYAIFAAELWKANTCTRWIGAQVHDRRLLVYPLSTPGLLLVAVASESQSWGYVEEHAGRAAELLVDITV